MSLLALDKWARLLKIIKQNGGIRKSLYKMWRFDTLKEGKLVGWDTFGNRYYQNDFYMVARNRWVEFADSVKWEYNASQVTAEWFGWLHHKTDRLPCDDPAKADLHRDPYVGCWLMPHIENPTGTDRAYVPYSTTPARIHAWDGCGSACGCRKSGLHCSPACLVCSGNDCSNHPLLEEDEKVSETQNENKN